MEDELKGNSNASKNQQAVRRFDTVTTNVSVKQNQSELGKIKNRFFSSDMKTVGKNVLESVIVPSIQRILSDVVKQGIDWLLYGSKVPSNQNPGNISYGSYYRQTYGAPVQLQNYADYQQPRQQLPPKQNEISNVSYVEFYERSDAEKVLFNLQQGIMKYGMMSVGDFYDMIDQHSSFTSRDFGWRDLSNASIVRAGDAYCIAFPPVVQLD